MFENYFNEDEKKDIFWNVINAGMAGLLVLFGSFAAGNVTLNSFIIAFGASMVVFITKLKEFWAGYNLQNSRITRGLFNFF